MMKSRRMILILVVAMASLLIITAVSADTISGTGWVRAQGDGRAALQGNFGAVNLSGDGRLWYKDAGEVDTPVVTGDGFRIDHENGWVEYVGFNGSFSLNDADQFIVILKGRNVNLFAAGRGRVYLEGRGHYSYGDGSHTVRGVWGEAGQSLDLSAETVEK